MSTALNMKPNDIVKMNNGVVIRVVKQTPRYVEGHIRNSRAACGRFTRETAKFRLADYPNCKLIRAA